MNPGDRVTAPHPLSGLGGERAEATFVGARTLPTAPVMQGPPLDPIVLHAVRYDNGAVMEWAEGSVLPLTSQS